jgi:hypothetical protein
LVLRHSLRVIDLVAENDKRGILELVHCEKGVELGFGFIQTLVVFCVDEENNTGYLRDYRTNLLLVGIAQGCRKTGTYSNHATVAELVRDLPDQML